MQKLMERIRVHLEKSCKDSYDILIGEDVMGRAELVTKVKNHADRYVIVTDSDVNPLFGEAVKEKLKETALPVDIIEIPAGEASKSLNTVLEVARQLIGLKVSRKSLLIALGGGVVGDVTGFIASIYMRSIPYIQIPTTLLAQVDSSVGGKTGVDLPEGKNLLGTFYQPKAVYVDLSFLKTLSDKDFANGLAEIIKYGIIGSHDLFELLELEKDGIKKRSPSLMKSLIARSCKIKADIVEMDEKELGLRRILNFGHTLGHALEAASGYSLFHGEAVSIGMVAETRLAELAHITVPGMAAKIENTLSELGLPTEIPDAVDRTELLEAMELDKKKAGGTLRFALPIRIGSMHASAQIPTLETSIMEI